MNKKVALFFLTCLAIAIVILSLCNLKARQALSRIMLSEICSKNQTVVYDRDGEYSDYIELYNPIGHAIDISGYKVSDKKDFENAYTIEGSVIESGEYKVIFPKQFGISDNETIYYIISIITDPANLFSFENGIYVKGKVWAANWDEEKAQSDPGYQETAKANYKMKGKDWRWILYDTDDSASMIDSYGLTG